MRFITNFKGHSGCKIKLYSENGRHFVRKISKSFDYNERLKSQMQKQKHFFENLSSERFFAPKVIGSGNLDNLFFFDMEYVRAVGLVDYIYNSNTQEILKTAKDICDIISLLKTQENKNEVIDFSKIEEKISDIQISLLHKNSIADQLIIEELKKLIAMMDKPKNIKETFCHGDLAMDNILYDKNTDRYYLIDFLDSYIEHYWVDITKLYNDIEGRWYKLRNPGISLNNMMPKMNFIDEYLKKNLIIKDEFYNKNHYLFLAINLARVLPYANDEDTDYLIGAISKSMIKFKNNL